MARQNGMHRFVSQRGLLRSLALLVIMALAATACSSDDDQSGSPAPTPDGDRNEAEQAGGERSTQTTGSNAVTVQFDGNDDNEPDTEIIIVLGDGAPSGVDERPAAATTAVGEPLAPADVAQLVDRLPAIEPDAGDRTEFNRPPDTRPPPTSSTRIAEPFPPAAQGDAPATTDTQPLGIVRFQPEGPVDLAPFISVTFDQPMVAVGTVEAVDTAALPITIEPELPGRWRWLGTRTVRFEYEPGAIDRLPAATTYQVEVASGTESATGGVLGEAIRFSFTTPTVQIQRVLPLNESLPTDQVFFVETNQRVDLDDMLGVTTLLVNGQTMPIRLAADDELTARDEISSAVDAALPGRWFAFTAVDELPVDASIEISLGPNMPSAEGPEVDETVTTFSARTRGAFELVSTRCGFDDQCRPGQTFRLEFTNPIDTTSFNADLVAIDPALPGARIGANWNELTIQGPTTGQTTYDITVSAELTDTFGQRLGSAVSTSVRVGDAEPALFHPGRQLVTLDPIVATDALAVTSINHERLLVRTYEVTPANDWIDYVDNNWRLALGEWTPNWPASDDRLVSTGVARNAFGETLIDLSEALEATGHAVVLVGPERRGSDDWRNEPFAVWVQRTTLGVDAYTDNQVAIARITDLATGEPRADVLVELIGGQNATTDADGIAQIDLGRNGRGLLATDATDQALLGEFWAEQWNQGDALRWHVLDDRAVYRPGETVSVKGWVRRSDQQTPAALSLLDDGTGATWLARDQFGNEIADGRFELSSLGGFDLEVALPNDITLGYASIEFMLTGVPGIDHGGWWHEFQVQEFRRPDVEVITEIATDDPHFVGDDITINATASYLAGGTLAASPVEWQVSGRVASYAPPNWPDFEFGIWTPWWRGGFDEFDAGWGSGFGVPPTIETRSSSTDAAGIDRLAMSIGSNGTPQPIAFTAAATVIDVNRQAITGTTSGLVHPADLYVGMRSGRAFVRNGETLNVDVIVTDLDGALIIDRPVSVTATRLEWRFEDGEWIEVAVPGAVCDVQSAESPVPCSFSTDGGGRYRITATVIDDQQRANVTETTRWVAGGDRPARRSVDLEQVTVIPDGESWQPGDTAELLVQAPFDDAHGLAIVTRRGIDRTIPFEFDDTGSAILRVPISDDDIPGIGVQVEVVGSTPRGDDAVQRPAYAAGQLTLSVPPEQRRLTIDAAPRLSRIEPGADTQIDVAVTTPDGSPAIGAELTVIVVDEAVLSLSNYELRDPLASFYPTSGASVQPWRGRATLRLADPGQLVDGASGEGDAGPMAATGGDEDSAMDDAMESSAMADEAVDAPAAPAVARAGFAAQNADKAADQPAIALRSDFDALAIFEPGVVTDDQGRAVVDVSLPDNLTRYRVMVVATAEATDAGIAESNITARLPVTVRPSPPRFANFGDVFEFPVVVQNATDESLDVDVALRATNLDLGDRTGITVNVPANDRVEVRFAAAADDAGTARYQVVAAAGAFGDAAEGSFPVYTPATAEAFATYGVIDDGAVSQPMTEPADVFPQFGGLEVSTSSTAVAALTDAVIYLSDYRYETSDALASRVMAIAALGEILEAFEAEQLPDPAALRAVMQRDIDALDALQNDDGGFPYWRRGRESIPYNSVQATHALVLAQGEGRQVDPQTLDRALSYLRDIEQRMPRWYDERTRVAIAAYAVHVRFLAGDSDPVAAQRLFDTADDDQLDVAAWVWPVLEGSPTDDEIERLFTNRVTETANGATFATDYGEQAWVLLHSDRRTDAIILDALVRMRPDSDLVVKTLNGLLAARNPRGHWPNVQDNGFVLLAGGAYFERFEDADPDFIARAWLGDTYAVEHRYEGRSTAQRSSLVPMDLLVGAGDADIVVAKDGDDGRLYYRLGLRYAPTDFDLEPLDRGFVVARTYEAVDDPDDVQRNADGSWAVAAGARVRVRVSMVADSRRTHVALIDPLPAGFEPINPTLATSEPLPQVDPSSDEQVGSWWARWFDHQNLRDDRAEAFSTWLQAGTYDYVYVARATTPGSFVVPPARAEMIYEPEVFGRSSNTTVTVIDES